VSVKAIVARSGSTDAGRWIKESRNEEEVIIIVLLDMPVRFPYASLKHHRVLNGRMIGITD
jgi:hypothetical protein